jgi:hypothetical protein
MNDTFQHIKTVMVYLNEVLHLPLLSRQLFSVAEWNRCGGTINFMMDKCRIERLGIDDKVITIDVDPIYAEEAVNQQRVHTVRTNLDMSKEGTHTTKLTTPTSWSPKHINAFTCLRR